MKDFDLKKYLKENRLGFDKKINEMEGDGEYIKFIADFGPMNITTFYKQDFEEPGEWEEFVAKVKNDENFAWNTIWDQEPDLGDIVENLDDTNINLTFEEGEE